jgi:tripartite-type tricarboxylate transporter receptor subunit TctC
MKHATCARVLAAAVAGCGLAGSADADDFYQGKQIKLVVGSDVGGGFDLYARLLGRHWPEFIAGKPSVVVQNMPGASSLKAMNFVADGGAKDGTVIGQVQPYIAFEPLLHIVGEGKTAFDPLTVNWIGSTNKEVAVAYVWHTAPVRTLRDTMTTDVIVGASGATTSNAVNARVMNALLGTRFKVVNGYKSGADISLAMERGEVHGAAGTFYSSVANRLSGWVANNQIRFLTQLALEKHPDIADVPLVLEFADSAEVRQQMALLFASQLMGRPFVAAAGVPQDRVAMLRRSFLTALESPELRADAAKQQLEINPMAGQDIQKMLVEQYATAPIIVEKVRTILTAAD